MAITKHITRLKKYALAHKIISSVVILVILFGGYKLLFKTASAQTLYALGTVQKGTVISSVTASGQVSATDQIDIKPKVSGEIVWVGVKPGQSVYQGQALLSVDNTDAKAAVADAEASLATAKLQLQKDEAAAPIDYQRSNDTLATDKADLATEYNNTFNTISNTYLDTPSIVTGMENILYGYDLSSTKNQWNVDILTNLFTTTEEQAKVNPFADKAKSDYAIARPKYDANLIIYKGVTRNSDSATIEKLLNDSIDTLTIVTQTVQSELNMLGTIIDTANTYEVHIPNTVTTMQTNARGYLSTANNDLTLLLNARKALSNANQAVKSDAQNITLLQVGNPTGATPISLQIEQANIAKQEQSLVTLKQKLADCTVTAPFAGTIASISAKVGDSAGASVATIITKQQIATVSLNEVDVAKIDLGEKATLTLDAIDGLSITGSVAEIDTVGTESQGVVTYEVKIRFDTQDSKVKSGMSVNANIITGIKQDVLVIPNSAIKSQNGNQYVEVFDPLPATAETSDTITSPTLPIQKPIETGLSNDTETEVLSGLAEGDTIVIRTTSGTAATTQSAPSLFGGIGGARTTTAAGGNRTFRQ